MRWPVMLCSLIVQMSAIGSLFAQPAISKASPLGLRPGQTTRVVLQGQKLQAPLAVGTNLGSQINVVSVADTNATLDITLPESAPLGPAGLWVETVDGPSEPLTLVVDELPAVVDNGQNHQRGQAQEIPNLVAVDGTCEASQSDFYRFRAAANQRIGFEVLTQRLGSTMDPVVRLMDAAGNQLALHDDEGSGPECRFSYLFASEGEYCLEIFDNRFAAGGDYRLRVGDFPIVETAFPLAAQLGSQASVSFVGPDASAIAPLSIAIPSTSQERVMAIPARLPGAAVATWVPIQLTNFPQVSDAAAATDALKFPIGISGQFAQFGEKDTFLIQGVQGQTIRVSGKARSLGLPTMLQIQLFNAANAKVAETPVNDSDEWSFDFTFPDNGVYRMELNDLLRRGGPSYGYYAEVVNRPGFSVALKADAKTREGMAVELNQGDLVRGAAGVDIQIARSGYDGPIDVGFQQPVEGLEIINPRIDAKVNDARIYVISNSQWVAGRVAAVKLVATAADVPHEKVVISSLGLRRIKAPHIPFPSDWADGLLRFGAASANAEFFKFELDAPIYFARQQVTHAANLKLKRVQEGFKDPVAVLGVQQPKQWSVSVKPDKDTYALTWTRTKEADQVEQVTVTSYAELGGKGRVQTQLIPVAWIDPLVIQIKPKASLVPGSTQRIDVNLMWSEKAAPQACKLNWVNLPAGVTGTSVDVAPDQKSVTLDLQVASDCTAKSVELVLQATTQFDGRPLETASAAVSVPVIAPPTRLEVYPNQFQFAFAKDVRSLTVTGFDANGNQRDWTHDCRIIPANAAIVKVDGNRITPLADGATELGIEVAGARTTVPVQVSNAATSRKTQFENEVLVALSKQTCNSGACHGSPSGKGGFRLSLRAFDQQLDQLTLVREEFGRRVNPLEPDKSLLLEKPLMKVAHGGGMQLHKQDPAYEILRNWIAEGASVDPPNTPRCVKLEISPSTKVILNRGYSPTQQMVAIAHFADGSTRDVSHIVSYETSNTSVAEVNARGLVTSRGRGEAAILVRFLEHIETVPMMFIEDVPGFVWKAPPPNNYVDELVNAKLQQLQYLPSETASDSEFLRRVYLDVIGLLPTIEETQAFLADGSVGKRSALIDTLLERPEHAKFWALKWGDLLRMTSKLVGDEGVYKYHRWVEQSIRENKPYDQFARELLTASGSTLANPASNFYRTAADTNDCVETISQVFLGARLQCAKCHNHPFERWTQDNYYGLGAFFQRVQRKKTQRPGEMFVWTSSAGEVTQPRTGQVMKPWLPQVGSIEPATDEDRRKAFVDWLVRPENPYFARIEANRIWSQVFAKGIVDPIDDFRDSNPPSNAPLLDALAKDFVEHKFDRKHLLKVILNSRTYQASYQTNEFNRTDTRYFSHQEPRLLAAEQLLDAVNATTGLPQTFGQLPAGTKATQLPAPDVVKVDFLKVFGQPERATVCACERSDDSNLAMAIELFNGPTIYDRLKDPNNRFRKILASGGSIEDAIRQLYIAAVCRLPTDEELARSLDHAKTRPDAVTALEDICWALLNTDEFLFQH